MPTRCFNMDRPRSPTHSLPIALTMGDPAGIGPEIALRAWEMRAAAALPTFLLVADPALMRRRVRELGVDAPILDVSSPDEAAAAFSTSLPVLSPATEPLDACQPGAPTPDNAASVISAIDMAVDLVLSGRASAVVTNPIAKSVLLAAGFGFPGHTEYLGALARRRGLHATPVMMLAGGGLRTVPVTIHIPLRAVPDALTAPKIVETASITHDSLIHSFGIRTPRIALTGLNPHAGEDGMIGTEERDVIEPAIAALRFQGMDVAGPLPADTAFHAAARARHDAVIAMYHDQALIPVKTIAFDEGVNITLGLPFVRTSPDHGTAFDIAGMGTARPDSLIAALKQAAQMAEVRARHGAGA